VGQQGGTRKDELDNTAQSCESGTNFTWKFFHGDTVVVVPGFLAGYNPAR
jgi:hypothetical protein